MPLICVYCTVINRDGFEKVVVFAEISVHFLFSLCSSEDELDVLLHGTPDQKRKLIREYLTGESESSSEDEFEKEMEKELSSTMKTIEGSWKPLGTGMCGLTVKKITIA